MDGFNKDSFPETLETTNVNVNVVPEVVESTHTYESVVPEVVESTHAYESVVPEVVESARPYESVVPEVVESARPYESIVPETVGNAGIYENAAPKSTGSISDIIAKMSQEENVSTPETNQNVWNREPAAAPEENAPVAEPVFTPEANVMAEEPAINPEMNVSAPEPAYIPEVNVTPEPSVAPELNTIMGQPVAPEPVKVAEPVNNTYNFESLNTKSKTKKEGKKEKSSPNIFKTILCGVIFGVLAGGISFGIWAAAINIWGEDLGISLNNNSQPQAQTQVVPTPATNATGELGQLLAAENPLEESSEEQEGEAASEPSDVIGVANDVMPSIVSINVVVDYEYNGMVQEVPGSGSGIIIDETEDELLIVTNFHVIEDAKTISVQFNDGSTADAEERGKKVSMDLAVIAVKYDNLGSGTIDAIKVAKMGDSDSLQVGQTAVAIGNAMGYGQSVTVGVISALDREITTGTGEVSKFIQTDAAINPGNSGGALLNLSGEVIGINSNKFGGESIEGMGYAIPITAAKPIIEDLKNKVDLVALPENEQSYLGISGADVPSGSYNNGVAIPRGVYVAQVVPGLSADSAGIMQGDIITEFNGHSVISMDEFKDYLAASPAGSEAKLTYKRYEDGAYVAHEATIVLGSKE